MLTPEHCDRTELRAHHDRGCPVSTQSVTRRRQAGSRRLRRWADVVGRGCAGARGDRAQARRRRSTGPLHLASDRTSCSKATANQFRLLIHTAAYWLLHRLRELAPKTSIWRDAQFDSLRLAFVKVAARVTELVTRIKVSLPSSYPYKESLARFADRAVARPA